MRLVKLHRLVPTTDNGFNVTNVIINLDKVAYFYPTSDGSHTIIRFDSDNEFLQIKEKYEDVVRTFNSIITEMEK